MPVVVTCRKCARQFAIASSQRANLAQRVNLIVAWHAQVDAICPKCKKESIQQ